MNEEKMAGKMTGCEWVILEQEFARLMNEALKSNQTLLNAINNASATGYAVSFSFINGVCYTTVESKQAARKRRVMAAE